MCNGSLRSHSSKSAFNESVFSVYTFSSKVCALTITVRADRKRMFMKSLNFIPCFEPVGNLCLLH